MSARIDTMARQLEDLEYRFGMLIATAETGALPVWSFAVSNPPTDAELDAGIDVPANLAEGYAAWVNDTGSARAWLVGAFSGSWWTSLMTVAP